jgi:alkanesulfonate monooxygenase SsuD/methylene tetrahydromethanopterin reductase-like flavin-dependent oxidoreductase (luciferase family)
VDYGLFMMPLHPPGKSITQCYDEDLATLVLADELGYREAWVGEHFTSAWENIVAPDLLMAKAIPLTERIIFGTGVSCLAYQSPFVIANRIACFDHLAKGRFQFGIGPGALLTDLSAFGLTQDEARDRAREAIQLILTLWQSEGEFEYHGQYWHVWRSECHRVPGTGLFMKPYQRPHPPIAVAGSSPNSKTLEIAGANGWIPMSINMLSVSGLRTHWAAVEAAAQRKGRTPSRAQWRIAREVYVAPTTAEARDQALNHGMGRAFTEYMGPLLRSGGRLDRLKEPDDPTPDDAIDAQWMLDHLWIVGDPETVIARLHGLYEAVGGFGTLLVICHDMPMDLWRRSLTLLASEVMPHLRHLTGTATAPAGAERA